MSHVLDGVHVVVTRPVHQAEPLCNLIEEQGGEVFRFPVIEIVDADDKAALSKIIDRMADFDLAIFISPNAVNAAMKCLSMVGGLPEHLSIAAVGQGSAKALAAHGVTVDIFPEQLFNSEALLALDELQQVAGKKIVIFRGEGGRELLATTLEERGAQVEYAECYRRIQPDTNIDGFQDKYARGELDIIIVTSNEGLQNLYDMIYKSGLKWLVNVPLLLVSERTVELARNLGFTHEPILATKASNEALLQALIQWRTSTN